ncbi:hypothetical protein H109_04827 [Trichophyton interdigitale MR816]|uniref:Uncharacterized protein n=1 Tax=Trichophyton interdigitale (strain MR816) TaxID=1215338 RepID=A0A059J605_TRIIM|nr:hypothetical protein H109_04827 [Trichophyton interdigitale MR816]
MNRTLFPKTVRRGSREADEVRGSAFRGTKRVYVSLSPLPVSVCLSRRFDWESRSSGPSQRVRTCYERRNSIAETRTKHRHAVRVLLEDGIEAEAKRKSIELAKKQKDEVEVEVERAASLLWYRIQVFVTDDSAAERWLLARMTSAAQKPCKEGGCCIVTYGK